MNPKEKTYQQYSNFHEFLDVSSINNYLHKLVFDNQNNEEKISIQFQATSIDSKS